MCQNLIAAVPVQDLSGSEAADLIYMREEEKLARDVYSRMYEIWGLPIFANIARSEQRHFEALGAMIGRYQLTDPAQGLAAGVFADARLSDLYVSLVGQGQASAAAALRVGATIEDLDIHDLDRAIAGTDNEDLKVIYQNLQKGSRNHLRAFAGQLQALGESYTAQYIDPTVMAEILDSSWETGMMGGCVRGARAGYGRGGAGCLWGQAAPDAPRRGVAPPPE